MTHTVMRMQTSSKRRSTAQGDSGKERGVVALGEAEARETVNPRFGQVGDRSVEVTVSDGAFEVPAGQTSFAPGSSGWRTPDGNLAWYELFARGASAAALLGHPGAGTEVKATPL
jgi:hypothetical protein